MHSKKTTSEISDFNTNRQPISNSSSLNTFFSDINTSDSNLPLSNASWHNNSNILTERLEIIRRNSSHIPQEVNMVQSERIQKDCTHLNSNMFQGEQNLVGCDYIRISQKTNRCEMQPDITLSQPARNESRNSLACSSISRYRVFCVS